jgi:hypothetical protein
VKGWSGDRTGAVALKIAMLDEVNESTAMFKLAAYRKDAPDQDYWLTPDADGCNPPGGWHLRIAGETTRMFYGETALMLNLPVNPQNSLEIPSKP